MWISIEAGDEVELLNLDQFDKICLHVVDSGEGLGVAEGWGFGEQWHVDGKFEDDRESVPIYHPFRNNPMSKNWEEALTRCRCFLSWLEDQMSSGADFCNIRDFYVEYHSKGGSDVEAD